MGFYTLMFLLLTFACMGGCVYWGTKVSLAVGGFGILLLLAIVASLYSGQIWLYTKANISVYIPFLVSVTLILSGAVGLAVKGISRMR
jgi:hypothetical protein